MKTTLLLASILVVVFSQAQAASFEELESRLRSNEIDQKQLDGILGKQITAWDTFTPLEKEIAANGAIISMGMEPSDDSKEIQQRTQAVITCMDTKEHHINPRSSAKVLIVAAECAGKAYKKY